MKDLTLKFPGNREFKSFLSSLDWEEDEDLQNKLLVDEIGFTYTETGVTEGENLSVSGMTVILSTFAFLMTCLMFLYSLIMSWSWKHRFGNGAERRK